MTIHVKNSVQNDAECDKDYYDEYEDYGCKDYKDYGKVDSDSERREKTNTEIADANSDDRRMKEQEDAEEREQSGYNNEGHSANVDCVVDDELDVLPLQGSKSKVWSYFGFPAINGRYREEDKKQ